VKARIEERLSVGLQVESETGDVKVTLRTGAQDPSLLFRAMEVVTAIGRGFSPARAFRLLEDEDVVLEVIDLRELVGRSPSDMMRLKGRVIGKGGKTRGLIEELSEASVSIYGHTISIIGTLEQVEVAGEAVRMLLRGSQHHIVYRFLQRKRGELKRRRMELWEKPGEEPRKR